MLCALAFFIWGNWSKNHRPPKPDYDYMSSYTKQLRKKDIHEVESPQLTIWQIPARIVDMMVVRSSNAVKIIFSLQWFDKKWTNPLLMLTALLILLGW